MAWQPAPMKVQCSKCKAAIFAPKSDVTAFFPHCRKCGEKDGDYGKAWSMGLGDEFVKKIA